MPSISAFVTLWPDIPVKRFFERSDNFFSSGNNRQIIFYMPHTSLILSHTNFVAFPVSHPPRDI